MSERWPPLSRGPRLDRVRQEWDSYYTEVLAPEGVTLSSTQYTETRRAFYAAWQAAVGFLVDVGEQLSDREAARHLDRMQEELLLFADQLERGDA